MQSLYYKAFNYIENSKPNHLGIYFSLFLHLIIILSAIDNLVKGASGQAIQNMNLLYKFPENIGLK